MIMRKIFSKKLAESIILCCFILGAISLQCSRPRKAATHLHLPSIFSDNMVLQQKTKVPVWGEADPGGEVKIVLNGEQKNTIVSDEGKWQVFFNSPAAGGPFELKIIGQESITFKNVMFGEVWLASGQSNMEMPLAGWGKIRNYEQEIAQANYPDIRLFQVEHTMSVTPLKDVSSAGWRQCSPETVPLFSATAYFFGRYLYQKLHVPIGLLHSSWGGTPAEAWTSGKTLAHFPEFAKALKDLQENGGKVNPDSMFNIYRKKLASWQTEVRNLMSKSETLNQGWHQLKFNDSQWKTMQVPSIWETKGLNVDGIVWFRKEIDIPDTWQGQNLKLSLGPINDFDVTWFNGKEVGSEAHVSIPRNYVIPSSLVKPGKNTIAVQILDIGNIGGMYGSKKQLALVNQSGDSLSLAGKWRYKVDPFHPTLKNMPSVPVMPLNQNRPTVLYNAMISPLVPYAIRGAIWYQGESNADRAYQYRSLFPALIRDWRSCWRQGDFPFVFVQLANFMGRKAQPQEDAWAELREAQLMALSLPNTGMAVAIDIGEERDIHPKNKQEVGRRLALNALHLAYGKDVDYSGPIYKSMKVEGDKIRLFFDQVDGGLRIQNGRELKGFAVAGADRRFTWAEAEIDGKTVLVSSPAVTHPVAVRYAWASNPECNLTNKAGLPASPFRTDSWKGITANH